MQCTKTGCLIYIVPYGIYAYGDAFESNDKAVAAFRLVEESYMPLNGSNLHYTVYDVGQWFDRKDDHTSTLISTIYENHGYEGKEIAK